MKRFYKYSAASEGSRKILLVRWWNKFVCTHLDEFGDSDSIKYKVVRMEVEKKQEIREKNQKRYKEKKSEVEEKIEKQVVSEEEDVDVDGSESGESMKL